MTDRLKAPFPWFGGKSVVAPIVWERFGPVANYVEPFFGSGAVLLARPHDPGTETVNDLDGLLANFWRALKADPDAVAAHADWPVNENDLHARHAWLVGRKESMQARLEGDPDFFDAQVAGWWVWGTSCWIGSGFCSGNGPWKVVDIDGVRKLVHVGNEGQGVNRQLVHVGDEGRDCIEAKRPHLMTNGKGINRRVELHAYFKALADRLRTVRVCCGDWSRVCGPSVTTKHGITGIFLDPPYSEAAGRAKKLYRKDCLRLANDVRAWAIANGEDPLLRIALCGYAGEHVMKGWECVPWKAAGGFSSQNKSGNANCGKERIWFSPNCLKPELDLALA